MDFKKQRRASWSNLACLPSCPNVANFDLSYSGRTSSALKHSKNNESSYQMSARRPSSSLLQLYDKRNARGHLPPYFSFQDPHLKNFYLRKFFAIAHSDLLQSGLLHMIRPSVENEEKTRRKFRLEPKHEARYTISVTTGKQKSAGTNAKVFLSLYGLLGKIIKKRLVKKGHLSFYSFQRGKVQSFKFGGSDVGKISYITIEHDGVLEDDGWFLEEVKILKTTLDDMKTKCFTFPCHDWLSLHASNGIIKKKLYLESTEQKPKTSTSEYQVAVVTGDKKGAGTDARVFLTIFGSLGQSDKMHLNYPVDGEAFKRAATSRFNMRSRGIGIVKKIRIEHDNSGFAPGWFLDRIVITDSSFPTIQYYFPCGQWLAQDEGDGSIHKDLLVSDDLSAAMQKSKKYKVTVHTGDKKCAGTDANVSIQIFGLQGDSGTKKLDARFKNDFERNKVDEFIIESIDLGDLKRIRIGHDNSGPSPGWFLDKVEILDEVQNKKYEFLCERWLARDEDDGQIYRDLTHGNENRKPGFPYEVKIRTGDVMGAGTSANVFLVMYGSGKKTFDGIENKMQRRKSIREFGENLLKSSGKLWLAGCKFERNRTNICRIEVMECLGSLDKIEIGHDNKGITPGWFLDGVVITCLGSGLEQVFDCKNWLAVSEGDGLIERTLYESRRIVLEKKITWSVRVHTCDEKGAGTDANVFIVLYGRRKNTVKDEKLSPDQNDSCYLKTSDVQLCNKGNNFESGQVDLFVVEMEDVGIPIKLRVWHDNSKPFSSWKLQKIEMENQQTEKRYTFPCDRWLSRDEDDQELVRELPATGSDVVHPFEALRYKVYVHTGKVPGAGTDANVFLCIYGEIGDTGDRSLIHSLNNRNKFECGQIDEFVVEAIDMKKLKKIRIGHDGKNVGSGWFLDKVVIQLPDAQDDSKKSMVFECNRWFDTKEDDGQIIRELSPKGVQMLNTTSYHVSVRTGTCRHAGTDAIVYIQLFGTLGSTGKFELKVSENGNKNKFQNGRVDLFKIEAIDIGEIEKIIIGHDGSGAGSGWFLEEVAIRVPTQGENYIFPCSRWLDRKEDDGKVERELYPEQAKTSQDVDKCVPYCVTIWTGNKAGAGTDANVFIQIYGDLAKSEEIELKNKSDNFEKGSIDVFKIEAIDVGKIFKIRIGHDGTGMFSGWFLHKALIQTFKSCENKMELLKKQRFKSVPKNQHMPHKNIQTKQKMSVSFDKNSIKNRANRKSLIPSKSAQLSSSESEYDEPNNAMQANTGQGTSASRTNHSKEMNDNNSDDDDENNGRGNIQEYWFFCDKWFAPSKGDGKIARELLPTTAEGNSLENSLEEVTYIVKVFTGNKFGAGTDANVFLRLSGTLGDSGEIHLKDSNNSNKFERKQLDIFKVTAVDLGILKKLQIRHDNKGGNAGWFLDHIVVEDSKSNRSYYFECKKWLAIDEDDGQLNRVLLSKEEGYNHTECQILDGTVDPDKASKHAVEKSTTTYCMKVFTGNKFGAGTDANVYIILFGKNDDTGKVLLKNSKLNNKFERNQVDEFSVEAVDLGDLKKIKIGHDNAGFGGAWFLEKVEIDIPITKDRWIFPHSRWIAKDKDDSKLEHEIFAQRCKD